VNEGGERMTQHGVVDASLIPSKQIGYADFQRMASDPSLSQYEKIGFPDSYRAGQEQTIFTDICAKLTNLNLSKRRVLDIGPGCSDLPRMIMDLCRTQEHRLYLLDGPDMLNQIEDTDGVEKISAYFPDCPNFVLDNIGKFDVIICYSVLQYVFVEGSIFKFFDSAIQLLATGGQMLIGDIPNASKRKRFFASEAGAAFHRNFTGRSDPPEVRFNCLESGLIDDAVIMSLLQRARASGIDAYLVPQRSDLPMANRREDILLVRP